MELKMYKEPTLDQTVKTLRSIGELLIDYNFPKVPLNLREDELSVLKQRETYIDGYPLILSYQKSDYETHFLESLQIYSKNSPFLPFNVVCKLGQRFLGSKHLNLVEVYKEAHKIYIWSVCISKNNKAIPAPYDMETEECEFEGLEYIYLQPSQVNFY